jgi:hypothetical protein
MSNVEQHAAKRATQGLEAFCEGLGGDAVLVRLDERGGKLDPAPWAFHSASAGAPSTGGSPPRDDEHVDAEALRAALEGETREGAGVFTSREDEKTATSFAPPPVIPAARGAATVYVLDAVRGSGDALVLGRDAEADVVVAEMSVSREHAELVASDEGFTIRDLGSSNGLEVNGRAAPAEAYLLSSGDVVAMGDVEFVYLDAAAFYERLPTFMD